MGYKTQDSVEGRCPHCDAEMPLFVIEVKHGYCIVQCFFCEETFEIEKRDIKKGR